MEKRRFVLGISSVILFSQRDCIKTGIFQVPGFQSFILETFAANCCLYSVLDKSFEFRDANSVS